MINFAHRKRLGFTLLEMMLAMSFALTIMGVLSALVSRVVSANATSGERLNDLTTLGQLARQFRRDVRAASQAESSPEGPSPQALRLLLDEGGQVEYTLDDGRLRRTASAAGQSDRWEEYPLTATRVLGWKVAPDNREVALSLAGVSGTAEGAPLVGRPFDIVALRSVAPLPSAAEPAAPPGDEKK